MADKLTVPQISKIEKARRSGELAAACAILLDVRNQLVGTRIYPEVNEVYEAAHELLRKVSGADDPSDEG
jgi:hypothetical protein